MDVYPTRLTMQNYISPNTPLDSGHPSTDLKTFRRSLGQFATGVTVITTDYQGQSIGMSVNSFAALSLDPALVLWSIRKESSSLDAFRNAGHYAVNILSEDQVDVSNLFAKPSEDRFSKVAWHSGHLGAPLLEGVICSLECKLHDVIDGGDHYILVGRVEHYATYPGKPLLFSQGRYSLTEELTPTRSTSSPVKKGIDESDCLKDATMLRQLHFSSQIMSSRFENVRVRSGDSVAEFRIYGWLRSQALLAHELHELLYLGDNEWQDALAELERRGHLLRQTNGMLSLTPAGIAHSETNAKYVQEFEASLFQNVTDEELRITRHVLAKMARRAKLSTSVD